MLRQPCGAGTAPLPVFACIRASSRQGPRCERETESAQLPLDPVLRPLPRGATVFGARGAFPVPRQIHCRKQPASTAPAHYAGWGGAGRLHGFKCLCQAVWCWVLWPDLAHAAVAAAAGWPAAAAPAVTTGRVHSSSGRLVQWWGTCVQPGDQPPPVVGALLAAAGPVVAGPWFMGGGGWTRGWWQVWHVLSAPRSVGPSTSGSTFRGLDKCSDGGGRKH